MFNLISNISFGTIRKFDNKNHIKYNKHNRMQQSQNDKFISSSKGNKNGTGAMVFTDGNMQKKEIDILKSSKGLLNSPVSFLGILINEYLNDNIDENTFVSDMKHKIKETKLFLSLLPQQDKVDNFNIFKNEFDLANSIIKSIMDNKTDSALKNTVLESVHKYAMTQKQGNNQP